jgi:hypothetical protein
MPKVGEPGPNAKAIGAAIEQHLMRIERLLPPEYKVTLLARHTTKPRSDILMTIDDTAQVMAALQALIDGPRLEFTP